MTNQIKTVVRAAVAGVVVLVGVAGVNSTKAQANNVAGVKAAVVLNDASSGPAPGCSPNDRGCTMPGLDPQ